MAKNIEAHLTGSTVTCDGHWLNYTRVHRCRPQQTAKPATLDALRTEVLRARADGSRIRVVGSGHSYSDVALAPETQLSLSNLNRVEHVDRDRGLVRVQGGITLRRLRHELSRHGLAFANMGDIDCQSLAGALSTGTHGTGQHAPAFASQITALQLMLADGSLLEISQDSEPDIFRAAQVSLGALGIITGVTLRAVPMYTLCRVQHLITNDQALALMENLPNHIERFTIYFMPYTGQAVLSAMHPVPLVAAPQRARNWVRDMIKVNGVLRLAGRAARHVPRAVPRLNRAFVKTMNTEARVDRYDNILLTPIHVRHDNIEYAIPVEHAAAGARAMLTAIEKTKPAVALPAEMRFSPREEAWLHPQYGRDTAWIGGAVHTGVSIDECWRLVEQDFLKWGGRPHWGKWHTLCAEQLAQLYPMWTRFQDVRSHLDPEGLFGSPSIDRLLGTTTTTSKPATPTVTA
jgi:L-gulono-1,4-lactone dehydrogenase